MGQLVELARAHAPLLLVAVPLIGSALAFVMPAQRLSWAVALVASVLAATIGADLLLARLVDGVITPPAQEGVALSADGIAQFAAPLLAVVTALVMIAAGALLREFNPRVAPMALALALCVCAGWTGALMAQDLIGLFVASEAAWLASVGVVALSGESGRGALNGALRMLIAGGVGCALMLLGVGLVMRGVGSAELARLPLAHVAAPHVAAAGVALVLFALALKAGVAPLHAWAGAAYGRAGGLAALAIGAIGAIGALAVLVRVAAYAIPAPQIGEGLSAAMAALGAASVVIGSAQAVGARNIGRLAAYACAAQAGGVLLSVALGSPAGFAAALVQIFALMAAAVALLGGAAAGGVQGLLMLDGMGRRAPLASAAITAGALSLMGAPLTIGFLGRWRLVEASVGAGWWWAAGTVIVASLAGVFYGGRLVERLYFRRAAGTFAGGGDAWRVTFVPILMAAIVAIGFAFAPGALLLAASAASSWYAGGLL